VNSVSSRPSPTAGLTYLGKTAFYYCTSLASVAIPDGVSSIGPGCFRDCSSLAELRLPSSLVRIDEETLPPAVARLLLAVSSASSHRRL